MRVVRQDNPLRSTALKYHDLKYMKLDINLKYICFPIISETTEFNTVNKHMYKI